METSLIQDLFTEDSHNRFKGATWFNYPSKNVFVGGAGGIGSWLTLFLSRATFNVLLADYDHFEAHNLSGQFFNKDLVGYSKAEAVRESVKHFSYTTISTISLKIDSETVIDDKFVFSAFDNMEARKSLFECWKRVAENDPSAIFIDGRLEMEQLQIFCVTPSRIKDYEKTLFEDSEIEEAACTMKQTSHVAAMIGSLMTGFFTNHISNLVIGEEIREVPFFFEFCLPINNIENEYNV